MIVVEINHQHSCLNVKILNLIFQTLKLYDCTTSILPNEPVDKIEPLIFVEPPPSNEPLIMF